jgi:GxxExxY protein
LHRELGPGLLEIVYQVGLVRELEGHGLKVEREVPVAIEYKGVRFDQGFQADLITEELSSKSSRPGHSPNYHWISDQ